MIWKYTAITKGLGNKLVGVCSGSRGDAVQYMDENALIPIELSPDYGAFIRDLLRRKTLSNATMATFFQDLGMSCESGMDVRETLTTLGATTADPLLKNALRKITKMIEEGQTLKAAFESTGVFPKMISTSMDAAERSGNIPEVVTALSEYLKFTDDTSKRMIHAFIYPAVLFIAITILTIVIATTLVPKLALLMPEQASGTFSAKLFFGYSKFMQHFWWVIVLLPIGLGVVAQHQWMHRRSEFVSFVYRMGALIKEVSLSRYFLCLAVYLKSGVPINDAITYIHQAYPTVLTQHMMTCRDYIVGGLSFWAALERDVFFPPFIAHNIRKGESQGKLKEYVYKVSRHYEKRTRGIIEIIVAVMGPTMVVFAVIVFAFIVLTFFMPIYTNIGNMADQLYR